jgi:hypothetical protein
VSNIHISLFDSQLSCMRITCSNARIVVCFGTRRTEMYFLWEQVERDGRM